VLLTRRVQGEVEIGKGTVVHPSAKLLALCGPITIGENCLIEERVVIKNCTPDSVLSIGDSNCFRVGSIITSPFIGASNVVETKGDL
jgi:dynactin-6